MLRKETISPDCLIWKDLEEKIKKLKGKTD